MQSGGGGVPQCCPAACPSLCEAGLPNGCLCHCIGVLTHSTPMLGLMGGGRLSLSLTWRPAVGRLHTSLEEEVYTCSWSPKPGEQLCFQQPHTTRRKFDARLSNSTRQAYDRRSAWRADQKRGKARSPPAVTWRQRAAQAPALRSYLPFPIPPCTSDRFQVQQINYYKQSNGANKDSMHMMRHKKAGGTQRNLPQKNRLSTEHSSG